MVVGEVHAPLVDVEVGDEGGPKKKKIWAVLVVHGVGDTRPGATVDELVSSLSASNERVIPDGNIEVHQLPDVELGLTDRTPWEARRSRATRTVTPLSTFPMHVRRAAVTAVEGDDRPVDAVFAEVYWADLSTIREGTLHLLLSLFASVFSLRHIAEQAVDNLTWKPARWLRTMVFTSASWLCGPIAALYGFILFVLAVYLFLIHPLKWPSGKTPDAIPTFSPYTEDWIMIGLAVAATAIGLGTWKYCRTINSGSTWTRLWASVAFVAGVTTVIVAILSRLEWFVWLRNSVIARFVARGFQIDGIPGYVALLLDALDLNFLLLGMFLLICGLFFYACPRFFTSEGRDKYGPAMDAAYGTAVAQALLWMIVIPSVTLVSARVMLRDQALTTNPVHLPAAIGFFFILNVLSSALVAIVGGCLIFSRKIWVDRHQPPYSYPAPKPQGEVPRLIVHTAVLIAVVVASNVGTLIVYSNYLFSWRSAGLALFLYSASTLIITVLTLTAALIVKRLRDWLHVIQDVINHFYRRWEPFPLAFLGFGHTEVIEFETQQRIEARFRAAFLKVLKFGEVTHLTVIAHSQGTVISADVLSLCGMDDATKLIFSHELDRLTALHLVTMGSPLTHLYQHYFPGRYGRFKDGSWEDLKAHMRNWVNLYRVDDYIGTYIDQDDPTWVYRPRNVPIAAGGHTGYWNQKEVFDHEEILNALPGATARATLLVAERIADARGNVGGFPELRDFAQAMGHRL